MHKILIIDDEPHIVDLLERFFTHKGYTVEKASDGLQGIDVIRSENNEVDLIIVDEKMPGMCGSDFAKKIKEYDIKIPVIILTGSIGLSHFDQVKAKQGDHVLYKPVRLSDLADMVSKILTLQR